MPRRKVNVSQTHPCRDFYDLGYKHGLQDARRDIGSDFGQFAPTFTERDTMEGVIRRSKPKRKLSAWNKFVKANANKPRFRYARSNKLNLKKMAIAFRKTPAGRKKRR